MIRYLLAFIFGVFISQIYGCGNGPKVKVYISDPTQNGMEFYDENTGEKGFVPYSQTTNFIAFDETDAQALFEYCNLNKTNQ